MIKFIFTHCGCYFTNDDPTLASNNKCSAFGLYEACERTLQAIENTYNQQVGVPDMNSAVGQDIAFIKAAMANARGEVIRLQSKRIERCEWAQFQWHQLDGGCDSCVKE